MYTGTYTLSKKTCYLMLYNVLKYITLKFYFHLTPIKGINKGGKKHEKIDSRDHEKPQYT